MPEGSHWSSCLAGEEGLQCCPHTRPWHPQGSAKCIYWRQLLNLTVFLGSQVVQWDSSEWLEQADLQGSQLWPVRLNPEWGCCGGEDGISRFLRNSLGLFAKSDILNPLHFAHRWPSTSCHGCWRNLWSTPFSPLSPGIQWMIKNYWVWKKVHE